MKTCLRCYTAPDLRGPLPDLPTPRQMVTEFVRSEDCDTCKAKAAKLEAARQQRDVDDTQTIMDFIKMAATIDCPKEWKERALSYLLPNN